LNLLSGANENVTLERKQIETFALNSLKISQNTSILKQIKITWQLKHRVFIISKTTYIGLIRFQNYLGQNCNKYFSSCV